MTRFLVGLLAAALALPLSAPGVASAPADAPTRLTYDGYLVDHLSNPAVKRAERFMDEVERRAAITGRPAPFEGYGKAGCTPEKTYQVGDERQFWAYQYDLEQNVQITATLAAKSEHGYVWVQNEFYVGGGQPTPGPGAVTQAEAEEAAKDWEEIYRVDRFYFGDEPNPDTAPTNLPPGLPSDWRDADCDRHVHILNFPMHAPNPTGTVAGYFSSEHEYPNGNGAYQSPYSNEAEMFFMNSARLDVGSNDYAGVLAHEFFHMIQFSNDYNEETWVNEGMADIAAVVNGFGEIVQGHVEAFEENPDQHLFDWRSDVSDYGQAFLFFDYLFNHYGQKEDENTSVKEAYLLAKPLTATLADGKRGINELLASRPATLTAGLDTYYAAGGFNKVYKDWLVANFIDDPSLLAGQFGYANRDVKVATTGTGDSSPDQSQVYPYGADYYDLSGTGNMRVTVEDPVAVIPANEGQPKPAGGFLTWSNRGDEMLTWLQRKADLRKAKMPQLVFKYWYDIEEDWDYAYVRVSKNGGRTWTFLNTSECGGRPTNPNGNNRAVLQSGGITGRSGGWRTCRLALSAFAGERVLIRFEYDTDQAVTEPGYVVDNVKLTDGKKAIWRTTKFETRRSSRPWQFGGSTLLKWLRLKPLAKNKPLLEVVNLTATDVTRAVVTRRAFESTKNGLRLRGALPVRGERTIVIFSGVTPIATDPFTYSYKVAR